MADDSGVPAPAAESASSSSSRMMREGGKLSLLTLVSRVLGLVREMTKAAFMGTAGLADSFAVAFMIPNFLRRLFAEGSITVAFIPTFTAYLGENDREKTKEFLSATLTVLVTLLTAVVAAGIAVAPLLVRALFGTDPEETTILTQIMFPFLGLVSIAALFQGILNSVGVFTPSGMAPILFNVCFIAVPYLVGGLTANPARAMAIGVLVGGTVQGLSQLPAVLRAGWRFGFIGLGRAFRNPGMRKVMRLIAPTIIGMAAYNLNDLVCTSLASNAGTGAASSLQYSLRLQELILGIFAVSAGTVLLPELTRAARAMDWERFSGQLRRTLDAIALVTIPVAVFSLVMGREIVTLLFKTRAFGDDSVALTTRVFFFHMLGLFFIAANRLLAPAFYAREDTKAPTWAGLASFGANIVLAVLLVGPMGGNGIALALSLASALNTMILVALLLKSGLDGMRMAIGRSLLYVGRLLVFSVVAALPVYMLRDALLGLFASSGSRLVSAGLPLVLASSLFAAIGIALLVVSRDEVAFSLAGGLRRRLKKG